MVDRNVVAMKLGELGDRLGRVRSHCPGNPEDLAADLDALDIVSFNLLLAVQVCLDLASHLISDEGWRPVSTARGAIERLEERGVVSRETARALCDAIGLRNIVAHGYSLVDPGQIHTAATAGVADLEHFATEVSAWVEGRGLTDE
jgi:uncharacterized protein YutE (UPF0331/DUF86 family)